MPKERGKTRDERRSEKRRNYLDGKARGPYLHTPRLLTERDDTSSPEENEAQTVCKNCSAVLSHYVHTFKGLVHQGSTLKQRKHKSPNLEYYRNVKVQNEWLRENLFDPMGNYLFCAKCICASLQISARRLTRQRLVKRQQSQHPLVTMKKSEVTDKRLGQYVVMPASVDQSFLVWWRSLDDSEDVSVRFPHQRHGNSGRTSNSAKQTVREQFLAFVDANIQPNGRKADSSGPTHYFVPTFTTVQTPKKDVSNYQERVKRSVVGEFSRVQAEEGKEGCSNGSASNWLRQYRRKVAICPHKLDYCDTCAEFNEQIRAKQTTLNRILQTGSSSEEDVESLKEEIKSLQSALEEHKTIALRSHQSHQETTKRCCEQWQSIQSMEALPSLTDDQMEELDKLKQKFTLTLSADYQMSKLVPSWGLSPQPGSTYYLQKLSHDIFGIVNHATGHSAIYIFDERCGPKNTDHTISYIYHYLSTLPSWIRRVHLYLDNAGSTNKNAFMMAFCLEMVQHGKLELIRVSFMIAGHTKFSVDRLFSNISQTFSRSDVFTTQDLSNIAARYASTVVIDDGDLLLDWRNILSKYTKMPGIRAQHDFICARRPSTSDAMMPVRKLCYEGPIEDSTIKLASGRSASEVAIPDRTSSYKSTGLVKSIASTKMAHLTQMYNNFIPSESRLNFLPTPT